MPEPIDPIQVVWTDADHREHTLSDQTLDLLRAALGEPQQGLQERGPLVARPGQDLGLGRVEVTCEDAELRVVDDRLPDDFPLGYHRLRTSAGIERRLIVSPGRCWLPPVQIWGWTIQLYGARSSQSWGIGDLRDLRRLRTWTAKEGGGFLLINPLHAVAPSGAQESSPYLPATRRFRNPLYLCVPEVPGHLPEDVNDNEVRLLATTSTVDRDAVADIKLEALRAAFDRCRITTTAADDFAAWRSEQARSLEDFATWCVLTEIHGTDWRTWPGSLQQPGTAAVEQFQESHREDISFHAWLQWQLDVQLREATGDVLVIQDLPIGVSAGGADAWTWQEVLAQGVTVGAPPDKLNSLGQDWGSPPLVPWRLREADYEPFIESVRSTISGAGGLRIDHVMGLFRMWWVPEGKGPADGGYIRYPSDDLLDIVALESHRAEAVVVGEDLGTVEDGVAEALAERGILSYKVLWFEDDDPASWPEGALAAVTTHDLPTVSGLWTGADAEEQLEVTDMPKADVDRGQQELRRRLTRDGLAPDTGPDTATEAAYKQLARAPSLLLSLSLEDAAGQVRRPNIPGTTDRDNWCIPLPCLVDDLPDNPDVGRLMEIIRGEGQRDSAR